MLGGLKPEALGRVELSTGGCRDLTGRTAGIGAGPSARLPGGEPSCFSFGGDEACRGVRSEAEDLLGFFTWRRRPPLPREKCMAIFQRLRLGIGRFFFLGSRIDFSVFRK